MGKNDITSNLKQLIDLSLPQKRRRVDRVR